MLKVFVYEVLKIVNCFCIYNFTGKVVPCIYYAISEELLVLDSVSSYFVQFVFVASCEWKYGRRQHKFFVVTGS